MPAAEGNKRPVYASLLTLPAPVVFDSQLAFLVPHTQKTACQHKDEPCDWTIYVLSSAVQTQEFAGSNLMQSDGPCQEKQNQERWHARGQSGHVK